MSSPSGFSDLVGRDVGVWGIGTEGTATLRRLAALGVRPSAVVDNQATSLDDGRDVLALDDGGLEALSDCEVVVRSPGISRYAPEAELLVTRGVHLEGGLGLWLGDAPRDRVVCVTGTKGKSTTSSVAGELVRGLGHTCLTGGNIGVPPWDPAVGDDFDYWVVETSSYQAVDVRLGPKVVVVTSLSEDHVPWHGTAARYFDDKLSLCTRAGVKHVVASGVDPLLRERADALGPHVEWVAGLPGPWSERLGLIGEHNLRNAALAQRALVALGVPGADDDARLDKAASGYTPLPSRLTHVTTVSGVDFVDDSLSTNVLPTLAAVRSFPSRRIALLVGGADRGIGYEPLGAGLADLESPLLVLTMPDNGPRIRDAIGAVAPSVEVVDCASLEEAVRRGFDWARPDGVVLLSPAAASFGRFTDYRHRAEVFSTAARSLG